MAVQTKQADVVVVGHGIAGLAAAVTAMELGATVIVVERAPAEESGGCTRYTEAYLRMKSEDAVSDDFEDVIAECGSANPDVNLVRALAEPPGRWSGVVRAAGVTDPEFISAFSREAVGAIQWLKRLGVRFMPAQLPHVSLRGTMQLMLPSGGGLAMLEALLAAARAGGVEFHYETAARRLIQDDDGAVVGVAAVARGNRPVEFRGRATVLASGGFEGSPEMLARYVGLGSVSIRPVAPGCHYNRGDGIRMAEAIGAATSGDFNTYHAVPVDARSPRPEAKVLIFPYGIIVNRFGRRFADEAPGGGYEQFDRMCHAIQAQLDGVGYAIVDAKIRDVPGYERAILSDQPAIVAETLPALAQKLGLPWPALQETVASYNAACRAGPFEPSRPDGLATTGLVPPKSHWARPIDVGPFSAYPLIASSIITCGGIKTDARARVLNTEGDPIPGLFAAGALVGIFYRKYAAATSVMRGAAFGRVAGREAVDVIR